MPETLQLINSYLRQVSYVNKPGAEGDVAPGDDAEDEKSGGSKPVSASTFNNITLSLPRVALVLTHNSLSLETLLQMFVSREPVAQAAAERKSPIILKQLTFGRLPQCLCLHVQVRIGSLGL